MALMRAARPKVTMTKPAVRLIQDMVFLPTFLRNEVTPSLRISHQKEDPRKMPVTRMAASVIFSETFTRPRPANTAMKEKMVRGLDRVRKKVETKSENSDLWTTWFVGTSEVPAKKVLEPRKIRKQPPRRWNQNFCSVRKSETSVRLKAAMRPYRVSAKAAPSPEQRPENLPYWSVLRMQRMPIGPTGAAIENPRRAPLKKKLMSIRAHPGPEQ